MQVQAIMYYKYEALSGCGPPNIGSSRPPSCKDAISCSEARWCIVMTRWMDRRLRRSEFRPDYIAVICFFASPRGAPGS